ncbi:MAG TPA: 4-(cytidine 5'-diphospho)-2-C-methyl-D-erythritol kinase [Longimicrobiales bacterium]
MNRRFDRDGDALRVRAPAKVNLSLRVLAREVSGYHQIETLFCALDLADSLELRLGGAGIRLEVEGAELGPVEDNLVFRAARAFERATGIDLHVAIRLRKEVPAGAGLGGGSSDAAATLDALNELHGRPLDDAALLALAATLGSDVPFFLCRSGLALAWGRGDRLLPLPEPPRAPVLVVAPGFAIPTADAYRALDAHRNAAAGAAGAAVLRLDTLRGWEAIAAAAVNDFEPPTFARFPDLAELKRLLLDAGATIALLSGSGSALFGVFPDEKRRDAAASALHGHATRPRLIPAATAA